MNDDIKINFLISRELEEKIAVAMKRWGFTTRAEFFRFCAVDFLRSEKAGAMPSDDALHEYSKSIQSVQAAKRLHKQRWL